MEEQMIHVITLENPNENAKGSMRRILSGEISLADMSARLSDFVRCFAESLDSISNTLSSYELDEIQVSIEVSAEGTISLLGSVGVGSTGGITLTFKRKGNS